MLKNLVNFVAFQAAWFACVVGAARGWTSIGPLAVLIVIGLHLATTAAPAREFALVAAVGLMGTLIDAVLVAGGLFRPIGQSGYIPPLWFAALWPAFATLLNGCLRWMSGRYALGAVSGAVGGPLSYWAGARLGALRLNDNAALSVAAVATEWALVTPLLLRMAKAARR